MKKKWSSEQFIQKANVIHNNKYDYSKSIYINYHTPIEISCSKHGSFFQLPSNHIKGRGCKKCGCGEIFDTNSFILKSKWIKFKKDGELCILDY